MSDGEASGGREEGSPSNEDEWPQLNSVSQLHQSQARFPAGRCGDLQRSESSGGYYPALRVLTIRFSARLFGDEISPPFLSQNAKRGSSMLLLLCSPVRSAQS
ncbi:hypothetical protein EYF80_034512 [Liparis tanakae]|uniref:Uncharacterized protein n=1 Tax=Liparis tanakae TaxID=230148 RepID=A0A4Z2GP61_9TELE|nr:hypothetical protein EYF80_034512 [Liparis tanakae]